MRLFIVESTFTLSPTQSCHECAASLRHCNLPATNVPARPHPAGTTSRRRVSLRLAKTAMSASDVAEALWDSPTLLDQRRSFSLVSTSRGRLAYKKSQPRRVGPTCLKSVPLGVSLRLCISSYIIRLDVAKPVAGHCKPFLLVIRHSRHRIGQMLTKAETSALTRLGLKLRDGLGGTSLSLLRNSAFNTPQPKYWVARP